MFYDFIERAFPFAEEQNLKCTKENFLLLDQRGITCFRMKHMWYFYVLQSLTDQNWFYKGSTNDLRRRWHEHQNKKVHSTKFHHPLRLVYYEAYLNETAARDREAMVKMSGSSWGSLMTRIKKHLDS